MLNIIVGKTVSNEFFDDCTDYTNDGTLNIYDVINMINYIVGKIGVAPHHLP